MNTTTKEDLRAKIKEIEERIKHMDRRHKAAVELKAWITRRGLTHLDLLAIYRELRPKRADKPVSSKNPLRPVPGGGHRTLKNVPKNAAGNYRVGPARTYKGDVKDIKYVSPSGQYVWGGRGSKQPAWFIEHLKKGGKPQDMLIEGKTLGPKHTKLNGGAPA